MKALIAAACVAVIAGVGFQFLTAYQDHVAAVEAAEFEAWRDNCFATLDSGIAGKGMNQSVMLDCFFRGGEPMKAEVNRRLIAAGKEPI